MAKKAKKTSKKASIKDKMLRVILRKKRENLGEACKAAGLAPANYYYHIKNSNFGQRKRGRQADLTLSSVQSKRLASLIKRQEKLQRDFLKFYENALKR